MRKTIKLVSAAMAAVVAISCATLPAFADTSGSVKSASSTLLGGWTANKSYVSLSKNPAAKSAFKKATKNLVGVTYKAIAVLGTQVVSGTNYAILCKTAVVRPGAEPEMKIMYVYEDLSGNCKITGYQTLVGELGEEDFSVNKGLLTPSKNKTVYDTYKTAIKSEKNTKYSAVAYLGKKVANGSDYLVLCRSKANVSGSSYKWSLVTVNKDSNGNASLVNIKAVDLAERDGTETKEETGKESESVSETMDYILRSCDTVYEAEKISGISMTAPEVLGVHKLSYIGAVKNCIEVRYKKTGNEILFVKSTDEDYLYSINGNYSNITEKTINGHTVTFKTSGTGVVCATWKNKGYYYSVSSKKTLTTRFMESIIDEVDD